MTAIVRPAIIESSLHEPSPGWLDGLRMADPLIVAIGKGRLRSLPLDPDVVIDIVPADMVVNTMLAAIPKLAEDGGPAVYQVATGSRNPVRISELHDLIIRYFQANPMLDKESRPIRVKPLRFPGPRRFRAEFAARARPLGWAETALEKLQDAGVSTGFAQKQKRKIAASRAAIEKLFYYGAQEYYRNAYGMPVSKQKVSVLLELTNAAVNRRMVHFQRPGRSGERTAAPHRENEAQVVPPEVAVHFCKASLL